MKNLNSPFTKTYQKLFKNNYLRFDFTPSEIKETANQAYEEFTTNINTLLKVPLEKRDFNNTLLALEQAFTAYWFVPKSLSLLAYFHSNKQVQEVAGELETIGSKIKSDFFARKDVYSALKEYADTNPNLDEEESRLLTKWMQRFERNGMNLSGESAKKYSELNEKRLTYITQYNSNLNNYQDEVVLSKQELDGMSDTFINRLAKTTDGKYIVTLKYPDYVPFMANARNEKARKELYKKFNKRGGMENVSLLEKTVTIRKEQAKLLGYPNYPEYVLSSRMAKNLNNLKNFLNNIQKQIEPLAIEEKQKYISFKKEQTHSKEDFLNAWDVSYWANQYKKHFYQVDDEKIKEYFPCEHVLEQMFKIFGQIFGIYFEKIAVPVWHKDVLVYQIKDSITNEIISYFYLDLFPRDGKYTHAATWSFIDRFALGKNLWQIPSVVIAANFTPAGKDIPSLLTHGEVETLFHEFGHVLQMSMATSKYASLTGDNIAWDYIETHSQLLENWAWEPEVLKKISCHYKTKESLDDTLIEKLIKSKKIGFATAFLRQNFLGKYDLAIHETNEEINSTQLYAELMDKVTHTQMLDGTYPQASFGHIMSLTDPYDVGYYVYAWSLIIAQDIFSLFKKQGIFNQKLGVTLRKYIYTPGTVYDENEMVEKFLERPYNNSAFLECLK